MNTNDTDMTINCSHCGTAYAAFHASGGVGCDATATSTRKETRVNCGYGSDFDTYTLHFQANTFEDGEICNACLRQAMLEGRLIQVESYMATPEDEVEHTTLLEAVLDIWSHDGKISAHEKILLKKHYTNTPNPTEQGQS